MITGDWLDVNEATHQNGRLIIVLREICLMSNVTSVRANNESAVYINTDGRRWSRSNTIGRRLTVTYMYNIITGDNAHG